jgi:hypothetical protein
MSPPNAGPPSDRLIYIAALPKSASSLAWLIVSALQEENGRAAPGRMRGVPPSPLMPLTLDLLDNFPVGGVWKSHASAGGSTDLFLRLVGCKYVVLLRHPADFISALYCHARAERRWIDISDPTEVLDAGSRQKLLTWVGDESGETTRNTWRQGPWNHGLSPLRRSMLDPDTPIDACLAHFLADGLLFKALEWMTDWLQYRDEERSIVVTYESLMRDFDATIARLSRFIRGEPPTGDIMGYLKHVNRSVAEEGHGKPSDNYPRGWTGSIDVWKAYLSADNIRAYNDAIEKFLACYPHASRLLSVYPELMIGRGRVSSIL